MSEVHQDIPTIIIPTLNTERQNANLVRGERGIYGLPARIRRIRTGEEVIPNKGSNDISNYVDIDTDPEIIRFIEDKALPSTQEELEGLAHSMWNGMPVKNALGEYVEEPDSVVRFGLVDDKENLWGVVNFRPDTVTGSIGGKETVEIAYLRRQGAPKERTPIDPIFVEKLEMDEKGNHIGEPQTEEITGLTFAQGGIFESIAAIAEMYQSQGKSTDDVVITAYTDYGNPKSRRVLAIMGFDTRENVEYHDVPAGRTLHVLNWEKFQKLYKAILPHLPQTIPDDRTQDFIPHKDTPFDIPLADVVPRVKTNSLADVPQQFYGIGSYNPRIKK